MRIYTVGGYSEVGKNMTVVDLGKDAVIFDAGLYLPPIVALQEREKCTTESSLRHIGAIPDDIFLDKPGLREKVRAIIVSHAHLDHIGAIPYLAHRYNAEIIATPYTAEVLKTLVSECGFEFKNPIKSIQPNSSYIIKGQKSYQIDFIHITHSTPQTSFLSLHTPEGKLLYANDFKFDNSPQLGKKPNYEAIKKLGKEHVKALIVESIYASEERKTPSEKVAKGLLEDVLLGVENKNAGIIVTTFSSHIARLKSIVEFGRKLNRKVILVGRSLNKYVSAAIKTKICPFSKSIEIASFKRKVDSLLKKAHHDRGKYLIICTGHQGEPGSILERISRNELPFKLAPKDHVIFSSKTIPTEINIENKEKLEKRLKQQGVRIFNDVHTSGHAAREDLRDFINMINPEHIIPAHGDLTKLSALAELTNEMGYKVGKNCHIMQNLQHIDL